jgi:hypothetical protein
VQERGSQLGRPRASEGLDQSPLPPLTQPFPPLPSPRARPLRKAGGSLKIVHEAYHPKNEEGLEQLYADLEPAMAANDALRPNLGRAADDLHPLRAQALLAAIPDDTLVGGEGGRGGSGEEGVRVCVLWLTPSGLPPMGWDGMEWDGMGRDGTSPPPRPPPHAPCPHTAPAPPAGRAGHRLPPRGPDRERAARAARHDPAVGRHGRRQQ